MNYRTLADLNCAAARLAARVTPRPDLIVGIPRSGLLAANLVALHLNCPLTDLEGYLQGRVLSSGGRLSYNRPAPISSRVVLVVDDSLASGNAMRRAREVIAARVHSDDVRYSAVFISPGKEHMVDYFGERCPLPRVFEWNVMHHSILENACVDMDGVLCRDPTDVENDDGENYRRFLTTAEPLFRPTVPIACIVTARLEKYRPETEAWLETHDVRYRQLIMLDLPSAQERRRLGCHAKFKAEVYRKAQHTLFIESSYTQAQEIARLSRRPVIAIDRNCLVFPPASTFAIEICKKVGRALGRRTRVIGQRARSWLLQWTSY